MFGPLTWLIDTALGRPNATGGSTTAGTLAAKLNQVQTRQNTLIGEVNATGGTATAGGANAKLNALFARQEGVLTGSRFQLFTANGTWIRPAGVNTVLVIMQGGGGRGARQPASWTFSSGAAGHVVAAYVNVSGNVWVTIGLGGAAVASGNATLAGAAGGITSFGTLLSASGGEGGLEWSGDNNPSARESLSGGFGLYGPGQNGVISNALQAAVMRNLAPNGLRGTHTMPNSGAGGPSMSIGWGAVDVPAGGDGFCMVIW